MKNVFSIHEMFLSQKKDKKRKHALEALNM